ncbi:hypothetical protein CaCOL14_006591 [Colletotrichum acutatum]
MGLTVPAWHRPQRACKLPFPRQARGRHDRAGHDIDKARQGLTRATRPEDRQDPTCSTGSAGIRSTARSLELLWPWNKWKKRRR